MTNRPIGTGRAAATYAPDICLVDPVTGAALLNANGMIIQGPGATGAAPVGNPIYIGARATLSTTARTDGNFGDLVTNLRGDLRTTIRDDAGALWTMRGSISDATTWLNAMPVAAHNLVQNSATTHGPARRIAPVVINQAPTVKNGAYVANRVVGGLLTFAAAAQIAAEGGVIEGVTGNFKSDQATAAPDLDLIILNASPTTIADDAAYSLAAADYNKVVTVIRLSDWTNHGTPSTVMAEVNRLFKLASGTTLYGFLVTRDAVTLTSTSDLSLDLRIRYI